MQSRPTELLASLVEQAGTGLLILDAAFRIFHWNTFFSQHSGLTLAEHRGRALADSLPATASPPWRECLERLPAQQDSPGMLVALPANLPALCAGTTQEPLHATLAMAVHDSAGQPCYLLVAHPQPGPERSSDQLQAALRALGRQHSERDLLLQQLQQANSQLMQSEKMANIGQLAAGVAHEINNPVGYVFSNLKTLGGYVRDLLKIIDMVDSTDSIEALRELKRNLEYDYIRGDVEDLISESEDGIDRVKRIISALKDFSHIEEEEFRLADLHKGIETTLKVVSNELKYKAEVVLELGCQREIECIPSQINQIVMNLLVNAAHAIDGFGRITLRTACDKDWAWLEVEDNGSGISADHLQHIFEPFFTTKPVGKGTGLGLALSFSIVQKHHGRIDVDSAPGRGTRFRIWLPVRQPATAAPTTPP